MTVEGRGAEAPGTQTPARRIGVYGMPVPSEKEELPARKIFV